MGLLAASGPGRGLLILLLIGGLDFALAQIGISRVGFAAQTGAKVEAARADTACWPT